jgi:hypothetical protein
MMARIEIWREDKFKDAARAYQAELDGQVIGKINRGESIGFDVQPGKHRLRLKIDWCSSPGLDFEIQTGQILKFSCGNNVPPLLIFAYITFLRDKYLWLSRVS